jgi:hypothetical protein
MDPTPKHVACKGKEVIIIDLDIGWILMDSFTL